MELGERGWGKGVGNVAVNTKSFQERSTKMRGLGPDAWWRDGR
jgi:hypothetical protein